ncbi:MAG TPA: VOC family protein [Chthonomonadaceae bacterium]|nr:VOC family protein [Chthonomonadaceae bacterium]
MVTPGRQFESSLTPMLSVRDAATAIAWYARAFGAEETLRLSNGERVTHCELRIGAAVFMVADEFPEIGVLGPESIGGSPVMFLLLVPEVDAAFARAVEAGAMVVRPVEGDMLRNGKLLDPFGHRWMLMTHSEQGPELA